MLCQHKLKAIKKMKPRSWIDDSNYPGPRDIALKLQPQLQAPSQSAVIGNGAVGKVPRTY